MDPNLSPAELAVMRELALLYVATFCDGCRALPRLPLERCPACREALVGVLELEELRRAARSTVQA